MSVRSNQVAALFRQVLNDKRAEHHIDGIGQVRVEYIQGTRFVFVGGQITSMKQVLRDAAALDNGGKTDAQMAEELLAELTAARSKHARCPDCDGRGAVATTQTGATVHYCGCEA